MRRNWAIWILLHELLRLVNAANLDFFAEDGQYTFAMESNRATILYQIPNQLLKADQVSAMSEITKAIRLRSSYSLAQTSTGSPLLLRSLFRIFILTADRLIRDSQRQSKSIERQANLTFMPYIPFVNCTVKLSESDYDLGAHLILYLSVIRDSLPKLTNTELIRSNSSKHIMSVQLFNKAWTELDTHLLKLRNLYSRYTNMLQQKLTRSELFELQLRGACSMRDIKIQEMSCALQNGQFNCLAEIFSVEEIKTHILYRPVALHNYRLKYTRLLREDVQSDELMVWDCLYTQDNVNYGCRRGELPELCSAALLNKALGEILEECEFVYFKQPDTQTYSTVTIFYAQVQSVQNNYLNLVRLKLPPPVGVQVNQSLWISTPDKSYFVKANSDENQVLTHYLTDDELIEFRRTLDWKYAVQRVLEHPVFISLSVISALFVLCCTCGGGAVFSRRRRLLNQSRARAKYTPVQMRNFNRKP